MLRVQLGRTTLYTSEYDARKNRHTRLVRIVPRGVFSRKSLFRPVVKAHAKATGLTPVIALFVAHGEIVRDRWYFADGRGRFRSIQRWIDTHDGEAAALILLCCNSLNLEIRSKRSVVIHLNRDANVPDLFRGGCLRMYHPDFGYIENNYYRIHKILGS